MSNSVNLALDVTKTGIQNPLIKVRQGDGGFETLRTTVTANGEPMDLQGWTITFMGTTAGNHKIVDGNVTLVEAPNGIFDYTPSKAWGMDIGDFKIAYFKFVKGDGSASSANFRVSVIEAVDLTQEEAQHYISVVDAAIAEAREHLESSLADVSSSVAATSSAVNSMAIFASSATSSAVSQVNSAASNASIIASSAVSAVSSASNVYVKKTNKLPAEALDFNYIATHMRTYQGFWYTGAEPVLNAPKNNWIWSSIEVIAGNDENSGRIITTTFVANDVYFANVDRGVVKSWKLYANDIEVVHKTGTETIAGDKTFTSPINGQLSGNAATATKWQTARTLALTGDVTGSVVMDGSGNVSIATTGANLVHKAGNESIGDDKTFTGKVTADNLVSNNLPVNLTKTTTSKMWYSSTLTAYRTGNIVTIVNNKQDTSVIADNTSSTETIPVGYRPSAVLFYPVVYGSSLKGELQINTDGTFTARGAINGQYRVTATYVTGDAWPV
ncbi:hypothetical protein WC29P3_00014 [Weissella phage WC29P3]|nr:hypothetical protein WC29P3_00014 [Weissella phage WC29P3]